MGNQRREFFSDEREGIYMIDWSFAVRIFIFGLSAVFGSLAILIGAIYAFGGIIRSFEKNSNKKG
jgi:Na+-transporting methylmalonyl-CoA/oxaloacetate decarboxylase gamma subunit